MYTPSVITTFVMLSAAALTTARMELPAELTPQGDRVELAGFGGHNKGTYSVSDPAGSTYTGPFSRSESRLGVFDPLLVSRKGKGSFEFVDAPNDRRIAAECSFRKITINFDVVTIDPKKASYLCELSGDDLQPLSQVVIGQPIRQGLKEKFLAKDLRSGFATVFGERLSLVSVHDYEGSKFTSQAPVGYLLRSGERLIAAVELTDWNPGVYFAADISDNERQAAFVAALAIAVYRDPALSALEDD